jgi:hypothetical protein
MRHYLKVINAEIVLAAVITLLVFIQWPLYVNFALNSDEGWFLRITSLELSKAGAYSHFGDVARSYLYQENNLGYGAFFWSLLKTLVWFFGDWSVYLFRALILVFHLILTFVVFRFSKHKHWLAPAFLILAPSFWWYAKIVAPDMLSNELGLLAVLLLNENRRRKFLAGGWFLLGLAFGIKLTAIVFVVFAIFTFPSSHWKSLGWAAVFFTLGFLFANPFLLVDGSSFYYNLYAVKSTSETNWQKLWWYFYSNPLRWNSDLVFDAPVLKWIFSPATLLATILLFGLRLPRREFVAWVAALLAIVLLVLSSANHSWYYFGFYFLTAFLFAKMDWQKINRAAVVLICAQLVLMVPIIYVNVKMRLLELSEQAQLGADSVCLRKKYGEMILKSPSISSLPGGSMGRAMNEYAAAPRKVVSVDWLFAKPFVLHGNFSYPILLFVSHRMDFLEEQSPWRELQKRRKELQFTSLGQCGLVELFSVKPLTL